MKVVLINTREATDRLEKVKVEMDKTFLEYELVYALPTVELETERGGWTKGADSLRRTTIEIVKKALEENETLWIWEDDCVIDKNLFEMFTRDFPLLKSYHFIHLAHHPTGNFSHRNTGCFRKTLSGVYNCQSYIISPIIMKEYIKMLERPVPIDQSTKDLHKKYQNSYIVEPSPVSHNTGEFSTIRQKIVDY